MHSSYKMATARMHLSAWLRSFDSSWQVRSKETTAAERDPIMVKFCVLSLSDISNQHPGEWSHKEGRAQAGPLHQVKVGANGPCSPRSTVSGVAVSCRRAEHRLLHVVAHTAHLWTMLTIFYHCSVYIYLQQLALPTTALVCFTWHLLGQSLASKKRSHWPYKSIPLPSLAMLSNLTCGTYLNWTVMILFPELTFTIDLDINQEPVDCPRVQ